MKRNFIIGVAVTVAAFFIGSEIAQAADISMSGHLRVRYENDTKTAFHGNGSDDALVSDATGQRVRLNLKTNINSDTSAFIQMQSANTWGNEVSLGGNDTDASVGIHQAYFTLKNVAGYPVTAQVGRQEIVLDGHRLFGHTGWSTFAHTHDAVKLSHTHGNHKLSYFYSEGQETSVGSPEDRDYQVHVLHNNFQGVLGGGLSTYFVIVDDDCGELAGVSSCVGAHNRWYTIGARQAGKMYGLDYRVEYYHQLGNTGGAMTALAPTNTASAFNTAHDLSGFSSAANRDAYMFGARISKSFANLPWKPKVTLWYDYLSGTSDEDMSNGDWGTFDTLFDTGHKFYGFMDQWTNKVGSATGYMGLQDRAIKLVLKPKNKWTLKVDWHNFFLAETIGANPDVATINGFLLAPTSVQAAAACRTVGSGACTAVSVGDRGGNGDLGHEVDLTLVHAYNPNTKVVFGFSQYMAENLYHTIKATNNALGHRNTARWAYVQVMVKF